MFVLLLEQGATSQSRDFNVNEANTTWSVPCKGADPGPAHIFRKKKLSEISLQEQKINKRRYVLQVSIFHISHKFNKALSHQHKGALTQITAAIDNKQSLCWHGYNKLSKSHNEADTHCISPMF